MYKQHDNSKVLQNRKQKNPVTEVLQQFVVIVQHRNVTKAEQQKLVEDEIVIIIYNSKLLQENIRQYVEVYHEVMKYRLISRDYDPPTTA